MTDLLPHCCAEPVASSSSDKVVTESLRRLSGSGLITKNTELGPADAAIYELSDLGSSFAFGPLLGPAQWVEENQAELPATT